MHQCVINKTDGRWKDIYIKYVKYVSMCKYTFFGINYQISTVMWKRMANFICLLIIDKRMLYFQSVSHLKPDSVKATGTLNVWTNALSHLVFKLIKTVFMQQKENAWFPSLEFQRCIYSLKKSDFQRNALKSKVPFASPQGASDLGTQPNGLPVQSTTCLGSRTISESC